MKKFCVKCGKPFESVGREVICPACKAQAAEDAKRAAVMKAKRASWTGESVPVRISGRASTVIRKYGEANNMTFAESLDALLKSTDYFKSVGTKWEEVIPYKSHRRDKATSKPQEVKQNTQDEQDAPQGKQNAQDEPVKPVKQAAKTTSKASASKAAGKKVKA